MEIAVAAAAAQRKQDSKRDCKRGSMLFLLHFFCFYEMQCYLLRDSIFLVLRASPLSKLQKPEKGKFWRQKIRLKER